MSLCSSVKNHFTQNSQNSTEFAPHGFRESPRRLRETNNTPQGFYVFREFRVKICSSVNRTPPRIKNF
ncbi:MAG: hypothetical protein U0L77_08665 [Prevotellamassilia sp.]|nr:hypothetical protein [Prevotellamassilia sp.]